MGVKVLHDIFAALSGIYFLWVFCHISLRWWTIFSLDPGFSRVESNACVLWSSDPALGIPLSFSSSIGMVCVRFLLRPTTTSWDSCRGWIKEHVNPLSFLQLRQCRYPGEIMWNKSLCHIHIISIPAPDAEQTQNNVWCGIDSQKAKSEWSLSSMATCLQLQDALKKDIACLYRGNISKRNVQWRLSCGNYSSSDKKLY